MIDAFIEAVLAESARTVLESMFFMELEPLVEALPARDPIIAELTFQGEPSGRFRLSMERSAALLAAADFLAAEPHQITPRQADEVVCELANMICGSILSRIESDITFRLEAPSIVPLRETPRMAVHGEFEASVRGGILRAEINMDKTVCLAIERAF